MRVTLTAVMCLLATQAMAGDEQLGRVLLVTHCSGCHSVDAEGMSPHPSAPPFRTLHERYQVEWLSEALVEGLVTGHPDMPEFTFEPAEADAIVSYLGSLSN